MNSRPPLSAFSERIPGEELNIRHARIRSMMEILVPQAAGLLLLGDTNIYYTSGTFAAGAVWLPAEGDAVIFVRKGLGRARAESALPHIVSYRSFGELAPLCREAGSPLPKNGIIAVDMARISWSMAGLLQAKLPSIAFVSGDMLMKRCRAVKTPWEIAKMRSTGSIHERCLCHEPPACVRPGKTEWQIASDLHALFLSCGNSGLVRITPPGRISLGGVAAGDSALYPLSFDGPLGLRGLHPTVPYLGAPDILWKKGELLTVDIPVSREGYVSDKTVTFFAGRNPSDDIKAAADCCADIYEQTRQHLRAGHTPSQVWHLARDIAARHNLEEMFMGMGTERVRFLGHGLGLEMDEFPAVADHFDLPLEENMVIALEPKIAIPGKGMVGMEDTFLVGSGPAESLSGPASPLIFVD